tara:strand:+ start:3850 stop:5334 length:1485 start_codon:yes stop_codon:yes gene_type:complete
MSNNRLILFLSFFLFHKILLCQLNILTQNRILSRDRNFSLFENFDKNNQTNQKPFTFAYNVDFIFNSGHPNIDNNAELYSAGTNAQFSSMRFNYSSRWFSLAFEPYLISQNGVFSSALPALYGITNNHNAKNFVKQSNAGLRQSYVILHYKGVGMGYGIMSHWWGPGFHSALALSTNAPSQKTYSLGTYKDLKIGNLFFGGKVIVLPYTSIKGNQLYFSGLKLNFSHHSKSSIITFGLHRTYLSGEFDDTKSNTNFSRKWTALDAARLVIEPLFGQSKKGLDYTIVGTPGFDRWDELISGYIKIKFIDQDLEIYADIASDDNRANFIDFRAHWDHTLGYQVGIKKINSYDKYNIFFGVEFLTTRVSNTFNPKFYRGTPNTENYYAKIDFDYFTVGGRRMGAHSGTSSDDLIFLIGLGINNSKFIMSYNKERHGIKSQEFPELKSEYLFSYQRKLQDNQTIYLTMEYEMLDNFTYLENKKSISKLFWISYSFSLN